jgi:hypothetical protein
VFLFSFLGEGRDRDGQGRENANRQGRKKNTPVPRRRIVSIHHSQMCARTCMCVAHMRRAMHMHGVVREVVGAAPRSPSEGPVGLRTTASSGSTDKQSRVSLFGSVTPVTAMSIGKGRWPEEEEEEEDLRRRPPGSPSGAQLRPKCAFTRRCSMVLPL